MNNKRIIKNELIQNSFPNKEIINVDPDNQTLHPVSSQWINTQNIVSPICLTKFQIQNKETNILNNYKCKQNVNNYKNYLFVPPIGLSSNDIIQIYDVNSIDKLYNWLNDNIDIINYLTMVRVVNCWIRVNFDTLKNYNNFLVKIVSKLFKYYFGNKSEIEELDKEIKNYIEYWLNKNNNMDFVLNLIEDFMNYMVKKYKIKSP
jgi:hypothetical protein